MASMSTARAARTRSSASPSAATWVVLRAIRVRMTKSIGEPSRMTGSDETGPAAGVKSRVMNAQTALSRGKRRWGASTEPTLQREPGDDAREQRQSRRDIGDGGEGGVGCGYGFGRWAARHHRAEGKVADP